MKQSLLSLVLLLLTAAGARAIPNPAAVYCTELGYTYDNGECVFPDGSRCGAWDFYCSCEPNSGWCGGGNYECHWPCQELACKEAGESVLVGQCCEGLQEIPPAYIYDDNCNDTGVNAGANSIRFRLNSSWIGELKASSEVSCNINMT